MIRVALKNLISNAIKFSQKSTEVIIRTDQEENKISISDIGISKNEIEHLFTKDNNLTGTGTFNEKELA